MAVIKKPQSKLWIVPCDLSDANEFVRRHHRHHGPVVGHKFSIAVANEDNQVCGVAIVGRPIARILDNGMTLEAIRVATDGTPNACSCLYGGAWRATKSLGYTKLITYIGHNEPGTSLTAAGWKVVAEVKGRSWSCPSRPRIDKHPLINKLRFEITEES